MSKPIVEKSPFPGMGFSGSVLLAAIPVFGVFYVLLILPFLPDEGAGRVENILFWPMAAILTLLLVVQNASRMDWKFFRSLPIICLIAYLVFAAASVTWAYSPEYAFSRIVVQILLCIVIVTPYALPIRTAHTIPALHICYALALALSAGFVQILPSSPLGHAGYFTHKQELGLLCAVGIILSSHELLFGGWRRPLAFVTICASFWLIFESQSKSAVALAMVAVASSWLVLLICKLARVTPALIVGAVVVVSLFVNNPIERIGYRLYGDSTLTGRTGIWAFIDYQISHKAWFGWGFHSYYFVPNSPHNAASGYIRDMPSSHSGYRELKLETGRIGYFIFMLFIYASLHYLERLRRQDPARAWCYLSIVLFALMINLLDSVWLGLNHVWMLYLIVVAETVHHRWSGAAPRLGQTLFQAVQRRPDRLAAQTVRSANSRAGP